MIEATHSRECPIQDRLRRVDDIRSLAFMKHVGLLHLLFPQISCSFFLILFVITVTHQARDRVSNRLAAKLNLLIQITIWPDLCGHLQPISAFLCVFLRFIFDFVDVFIE